VCGPPVVPPGWNQRGGGGNTSPSEGAEGAISNDLRENLALCILFVGPYANEVVTERMLPKLLQ
jgi:hypothetical protein